MRTTVPAPLEQASRDHLADCRFRHLAQSTRSLYEYIETDFLKFLRAVEAPLALHSLNANRVREWAAWHLDQGAGMGKRAGSAMVHLGVGILKTWSRWLVAEDVLEADFVGKLRRPKTTTTSRQAYEAWEIQALRGSMAETVTGIRDIAALSPHSRS
jgi:site-specific recombinase XerD